MKERVKLLPEALKVARKAAGMSQAKLAADAGISVGYVAMIELGQRQPDKDKVEAIALALGVPLAAISVPME